MIELNEAQPARIARESLMHRTHAHTAALGSKTPGVRSSETFRSHAGAILANSPSSSRATSPPSRPRPPDPAENTHPYHRMTWIWVREQPPSSVAAPVDSVRYNSSAAFLKPGLSATTRKTALRHFRGSSLDAWWILQCPYHFTTSRCCASKSERPS